MTSGGQATDPLVQLVESQDARYFMHNGEGFVVTRLPRGTRVVYPRPPLPAIADVRGAVRHALEHPLGCDPLRALVGPGAKVTIAFDDLSLPLPPMRAPDLRQIIIEEVVDLLAAQGVDDIHLVAAVCLHRHMTPAELRRILGRRIFNQFHPAGRLTNHDAEDKANIVHLGVTERGEDVELPRRAVESDLLMYVNINLVAMDGGHKSIPIGLGTYRSIRHNHNVTTLLNSRSYMDPPRSAMHHSASRQGKVVEQHVRTFTIETTVNNHMFPDWLGFLERREDQFSAWDWAMLRVNKTVLDVLPQAACRRIFQAIKSPYGLTGVHAGRTDPVHERTLANIERQHIVPVDGQSDILIVGVPYIGPYNVLSIMNPILVMCMALGYLFNFYRGKPLVREGGVLIFQHPLEWKFHPVHHPSYIEFFDRVLADTTDPKTIEAKYEEEFAHNPRYIDRYRFHHAFHGVHPFYMWYWGCHALKHLGRVISVNPRSPQAAARMGFATAKHLAAALEMASEVVGPSPSITLLHMAPIVMCDVR